VWPLSVITQISEWLLSRSPVNILQLTSTKLRWCSGSYANNRIKINAFDSCTLDQPAFAGGFGQKLFKPDIILEPLKTLTGYRFPLEKYASVILPDQIFYFGSFHVPAVAAKAGLQPFLEREIHKSTTLSYKDFAVRYEFGEKRDNKIPIQYCAISKNSLAEVKELLDQANIVPVSIQPSFTGIVKLLKSLAGDAKHPSIFLHFGPRAITAGIYNSDGLRAIHTIDKGFVDLLGAIKQAADCSDADAIKKLCSEIVLLDDPNSDAQAEVETYQHIEPVLVDLLQKIYGFLLLFSNDHPEESGFVKIVLSGEGTRIRNLDKLITANLGIPSVNIAEEMEEILSELKLPEGESVATLAPVIGNIILSPWQLDRYDRIMAA
jgi:hypothetical protein